MSQTVPYEQLNYLGEFASDSNALAQLRADRWDTNGDGTGVPHPGMWYVNTTSFLPRMYITGGSIGAGDGWVNINFDVDAFHNNISNEFGDVAVKASIVTTDKFLIEDSEDSGRKKAVTLETVQTGSILYSNYISVVGTTTSTALTDTLIPNMTDTPPDAGDYIILVNGAIANSSKGRTMHITVYVGGVLIPDSEVDFQPGEANYFTPFAVNTKVTVNGAQAIEVRWRTDAGNPASTMTMLNRRLTIFQVG